MSEKMRPISFTHLLNRIMEEYINQNSIFGIPSSKFLFAKKPNTIKILMQELENPIGPAAGPHTQLAQNIICSYLVGGRFFELKTVQKLDNLKIDKPCIDAQDEGYNVEWSQELSLSESYDEYLKAWILIHLLRDLLGLSLNERGFIFNMSVGYDLEGIKIERMDRFIEELKDASKNKLFETYKSILVDKFINSVKSETIKKQFTLDEKRIEQIVRNIQNIPTKISSSVTLSTMHGCPSEEIEAIAKYLIGVKQLHTYVKLNPTLLGCEYVKDTLQRLGYKDIVLDNTSFDHDIKYNDTILMLNRLRSFAAAHNKFFGIKLSNTLGVKNTKNILPGSNMYMSGRALFPLTINLAYKLAAEFYGDLNISYSGGATAQNINEILETGIKPVTFATDLLKPGGYLRLKEITDRTTSKDEESITHEGIDLVKLKKLAEAALIDKKYLKRTREVKSIKISKRLPLFDCYISPCTEACPIHQDISAYIKLVEQKRFEEAYELIVSKNPLPHITGYICDHQCMNNCTRWDYEEPVLIRELKKEAAEKGFLSYIHKFDSGFLEKQNDIQVAVIGAGPSGLSAAYFLARAGFDVTIFEKEMNAGGIIKNVLPRFRLPEEAIRKDLALIEKHGIRFVFGINPVFSVENLKRDGHKYIYIAIGAEQSNKLQLEGDNENIYDAIEFLRDYRSAQQFNLGKKVAVIGGGNSAMDSARAAKRFAGVEKVYLVYRRTQDQMPADKDEFHAALKDGVDYYELLLPVKFYNNILVCQKMMLDKPGLDGRMGVIPVQNEFEEIEVDSVISAIGEHTDLDILRQNKISFAANKASVNELNETNIENVFIGGDTLRGPSTVVESIADGKTAAEAIIQKENLSTLQPKKNYFGDNLELLTEINEHKGKIINQYNTDLGLEAGRCLNCDLICNKCVEVCPNRANVLIDTSDDAESFKDKYQILHVDALCNECGNCETFCPYQNAPYKEKFTLFGSEYDFENSSNSGFFIKDEKGKRTVLIKYGSTAKKIILDSQEMVRLSAAGAENYGKKYEKILSLIKIIQKNYSHLIYGYN